MVNKFIKKQMQDIFSGKRIKSIKSLQITADTREKQSLVASELIDKNVEVQFEHLEIADYIVGEIAVERKTLSDFITSMTNKRLSKQLQEIKKHQKYILILENFKFDYNNFANKNALRGFLLSIILDKNVPIIYTENERETAEILTLLAKRQTKSNRDNPLRPSRTLMDLSEQKQFILEGFPGIGPAIAKRLIQTYGSLQEVFNAPEEELSNIKGFHRNKIKKFKEIISCR